MDMRRKIAFLLVLVGLVGIIFGVIKLFGNRSPKQGVLKINSTPAASVFLDNKHLGRTPFEDKVAVGEYTIKIVPEQGSANLASWQGKITVKSNILTYVNRDLSESELTSAGEILWLEKINSKHAEISVTTIPDGGTVFIDDEARGTTPVTLQNISAGDHSLTIASPGFLARTLKIKATSGYRLTSFIQLALSANQAMITPTPETTPMEVLGITAKPTPSLKITPTKSASSSGTIDDPPKPFVIIKDTPTGYLRVRMEPSTSATESGRVNPGEKYTFFDSRSGWYQIKFDGVNTGWISGQYTTKVE